MASNIELCKLKKTLKVIYTFFQMSTFIAMWVFGFNGYNMLAVSCFVITSAMCLLGEKYKLGCCH